MILFRSFADAFSCLSSETRDWNFGNLACKKNHTVVGLCHSYNAYEERESILTEAGSQENVQPHA